MREASKKIISSAVDAASPAKSERLVSAQSRRRSQAVWKHIQFKSLGLRPDNDTSCGAEQVITRAKTQLYFCSHAFGLNVMKEGKGELLWRS